jgi:hypothetical protein
MKPIKIVLKKGEISKSNRVGEFNQSILYASIEISQ